MKTSKHKKTIVFQFSSNEFDTLKYIAKYRKLTISETLHSLISITLEANEGFKSYISRRKLK